MTEEQRRRIEARLLEERERVLRLLGRFGSEFSISEQEGSGELTSYPLHMADEGTDANRREVDFSIAEREGRTLEQIDDALRRFYREPERFGICEDTGEPIPFERLELVPWARTCGEAGAA